MKFDYKREKDYIFDTQQNCLEGLNNGQNQLNALGVCFAWEMPEKVGERQHYLIYLGYHFVMVVLSTVLELHLPLCIFF